MIELQQKDGFEGVGETSRPNADTQPQREILSLCLQVLSWVQRDAPQLCRYKIWLLLFTQVCAGSGNRCLLRKFTGDGLLNQDAHLSTCNKYNISNNGNSHVQYLGHSHLENKLRIRELLEEEKRIPRDREEQQESISRDQSISADRAEVPPTGEFSL